MPGRGPQTFKKRQKEQQRKEKQEAKIARRHARRDAGEQPQLDNSSTAEQETAQESSAE
jgi:hypothetical protein